MRKLICSLLMFVVCLSFVLQASAAQEPPVIIMQPQSPCYPEYSVAMYTVKVEGSNLRAIWYMEWMGNTYCLSNLGGAMQPWEGYAGESYGPRQLDANNFAFIFEGIESDLDGAYIWCVIEDGHYDIVSSKVRISVGDYYSPPQIQEIPAELVVEQGDEAEIRCVANSVDESQLSFTWYETDTGKLEDIYAVNRGTETSDYMFCDTSRIGTRYYICKVDTSNGGIAYSSPVAVTVIEKQVKPTQPTETLPPTTVPATEPEPTETVAATSEPTVPQATTPPTEKAPPVENGTKGDSQMDGTFWLILALVAISATSTGALVAVLMIKKKS